MVQPNPHAVKYDLTQINIAYGLDLLVQYARDMWIKAMAEITAKRMNNFTAQCRLSSIHLIQQDMAGKKAKILYFATLNPPDVRSSYLASSIDVKFDEAVNGWFLNNVPFHTIDVEKWFQSFCKEIQERHQSAIVRRDGLALEYNQ